MSVADIAYGGLCCQKHVPLAPSPDFLMDKGTPQLNPSFPTSYVVLHRMVILRYSGKHAHNGDHKVIFNLSILLRAGLQKQYDDQQFGNGSNFLCVSTYIS